MYACGDASCTVNGMDVAISVLRSELANWVERARAGEEVVVTDKGIPVAHVCCRLIRRRSSKISLAEAC